MKRERAGACLEKCAIRSKDQYIGRFVRYDEAATCIDIAEQETEERVCKELTRWHDPKEELPVNDLPVLCKVDDCEVSAYLVLQYYEGCWWACRTHRDDDYSEDTWELFYGTVRGWREIPE